MIGLVRRRFEPAFAVSSGPGSEVRSPEVPVLMVHSVGCRRHARTQHDRGISVDSLLALAQVNETASCSTHTTVAVRVVVQRLSLLV